VTALARSRSSGVACFAAAVRCCWPVAVPPSRMALARMLSSKYSTAVARVSWTRAALAEAYGAICRSAISAVFDAMFRMTPPPRWRMGPSANFVRKNGPLRLVSQTASQLRSSTSCSASSGGLVRTAALLTRMSSVPKRLIAVATARSHSATTEMSAAVNAKRSVPSSARSSSPSSRRRATPSTAAPAWT